ncbi:MAG: N(4)-(beta-N-acetylglucosaminyl)-L-asparaginase [Gemmatimonadota bacterium]
MTVSRREFVERGAAAAAAAVAAGGLVSPPELAAQQGRRARPPVVIASSNGLRGVKVARDRILAGEDTLDAIIAGVNIQELDPEDTSVGLGGLPNADGVVQLDASCMHGPTRRAGAVACLEDIATPSLVAKAIMDYTDHILLVGDDARRFAVSMGFPVQNLLTEKSRQEWLRWRSRLNPADNWLDHDDDVRIRFSNGTINMNAVSAAGDISSVTTTSGRAWKIPGRVGDSPIIGAGQYCDNTVGAAGSTGRGEACIKVCGAFLAVEQMRLGRSPEQALLHVVERVVAMTESRLLGPNGRPRFDLDFYAVHKDGRYAGVSAYEGGTFAICDDAGPRIENSAWLYRRSERPA